MLKRTTNLISYHFSIIRVQSIFNYLILLFTLVACNSTVSADKPACPDSANEYWTIFRSSVLKNDTNAIADLSQFPFIISSGIVDDDRKNTPIEREIFIKQFPLLLIIDPGLSLEASTMWDFIEANEKLANTSCSEDGKQFRVVDWVFEYKHQAWKFVQAYTGEQ